MACDQCNECNECIDPCNEECLGCTLKINDDCVFLSEAIPGLDSPVGTTYNDVITEILEDITALQALVPAVDYVNDVTLNGNTLAFLGTGHGFTGNVDLGPALAGLSKYELLLNNTTPFISPSIGVQHTLMNANLFANTLGVDDDYIKITGKILFGVGSGYQNTFRTNLYEVELKIGNITNTVALVEWVLPVESKTQIGEVWIEADLHRVSTTELRVDSIVTVKFQSPLIGQWEVNEYKTVNLTLPVPDLTTDLKIELAVLVNPTISPVGGKATAQQLTVEHYKQ